MTYHTFGATDIYGKYIDESDYEIYPDWELLDPNLGPPKEPTRTVITPTVDPNAKPVELTVVHKYFGAIQTIASACKLGAQGWAPALVEFNKIPMSDRVAVGAEAIKLEPRAAPCVQGLLKQFKAENAAQTKTLMMVAVVGAGLLFLVTR